MFSPRIALILTACTAVVWTTAAAGPEELAQEMMSCRALLTADERLSCYDRVIDEETGLAINKEISSPSEPQLGASQTRSASRVEPVTAEPATGEKQTETTSAAEVLESEDTGSAIDKEISSQSEPQLGASETKTESRVEPVTTESATGEKQTETTSAAEVFESQEALFGMSAEEQLRAVREESAREEIDEIEAGISQLRYTSYGKTKFVIWLDNGHIWQQIDSQNLRLFENDRVVVRRASMGSFLLKKVGTNGSMRVRRID